MKKVISLSVVLLLMASLFIVNAGNIKKNTVTTVANAAKVEVYYFHFTRRCVTCQAVETVTREAISEMYPTLLKNGQITFKSINLDEKQNEAIAKQCQSEGQSLLFIAKGKRIDLTDKGFMYAKSSPEKLKAEIKKTIDALL